MTYRRHSVTLSGHSVLQYEHSVESVEDNRTAVRDIFMLLKEFAETISRQNVEIDNLTDLKTKFEHLEEE